MPVGNFPKSSDDLLVMRWAPAQAAAMAVGTLFLVIGALGFIPGVTTHYDQLAVGGHHSHAMLLGLFDVSVLHNIVHLIFGAVGIVLARSFHRAQSYLIAGGAIYLALSLYGVLIDRNSTANFVPVNGPDNWLHLGIGIAMVGLGLSLLGRRSDTAAVGEVSAPTSPEGRRINDFGGGE